MVEQRKYMQAHLTIYGRVLEIWYSAASKITKVFGLFTTRLIQQPDNKKTAKLRIKVGWYIND